MPAPPAFRWYEPRLSLAPLTVGDAFVPLIPGRAVQSTASFLLFLLSSEPLSPPPPNNMPPAGISDHDLLFTHKPQDVKATAEEGRQLLDRNKAADMQRAGEREAT